MNGLETRYSVHLEYRRLTGEVLWWKFDCIRLRIAKDTFYTPDFMVMLADESIEIHETKGHWEDDARVKIKVAAQLFPFRFYGVTEIDKKGSWRLEEFVP